MEAESAMQGEMEMEEECVTQRRQPATCNLPATALPVGTHAAVRDGKAVTQAVGACDVELSNHVWRRPPRAHGMGVCCCIAGRHARSTGSSTRPQMLGRDNGRTVGGCCVQQIAEPGRWVTLSTRPSRHAVVYAATQRAAAAAHASIASPQRLECGSGRVRE